MLPGSGDQLWETSCLHVQPPWIVARLQGSTPNPKYGTGSDGPWHPGVLAKITCSFNSIYIILYHIISFNHSTSQSQAISFREKIHGQVWYTVWLLSVIYWLLNGEKPLVDQPWSTNGWAYAKASSFGASFHVPSLPWRAHQPWAISSKLEREDPHCSQILQYVMWSNYLSHFEIISFV